MSWKIEPNNIHNLPLTSLQSIILTTGPFVFLWSLLRMRVSQKGPYRIFSFITQLNSQFYSLFSAVLFYLLLNTYFHDRQRLPGHDSLISTLTTFFPGIDFEDVSVLGYIYHVSKIYEYVDVLNLVAQGKTIGNHMAFHHLSTPYLTYFRVLNCRDDWRVFATCNAFHHAVMYAYFGGLMDLGVFGVWWRRMTRCTGYVQLVAGIAVDAVWVIGRKFGGPEQAGGTEEEGDEMTNRIICLLLLGRYFLLFTRELLEGKKQSAAGLNGAVGQKEKEKKKQR